MILPSPPTFAQNWCEPVNIGGTVNSEHAELYPQSGASWGSQGIVVFAPTRVSPLMQVSDAAGGPKLLTRYNEGENSHRWPEFLPGGKTVLFGALRSSANWENADGCGAINRDGRTA